MASQVLDGAAFSRSSSVIAKYRILWIFVWYLTPLMPSMIEIEEGFSGGVIKFTGVGSISRIRLPVAIEARGDWMRLNVDKGS